MSNTGLLDSLYGESKFQIGDVIWYCNGNNVVSGKVKQKRYNLNTKQRIYVCQNDEGDCLDIFENDAFGTEEEAKSSVNKRM